MVDPDVALPQIAILGAGIFVRTQYIPRLKELADRVIVKSIWSRSEESAKAASELARDFAPNIEYKWGDSGIEEIIQDSSITAVAVVLAAQVQIEVSLKMLRAGKHVIQEKPAAGSVSEAEAALSSYNSFCNDLPRQPVWALAENYRFEPAFVESRKLLNSIGDMMHVQVSIEGSMNSKNPYFSSSWRRNFTGGFILDMGVHFIAGLRMIVGCEINMVSAITRHVDVTLPPPDNICSLFQLENGCAGVFVMAVNSSSPKIYWRIDGSKGALQIERDIDNGRHGYMVRFYTAGGHCQSTFYPFSGVNEELKAFISDVLQTNNKEGSSGHNPEARSSYIEGARDVAVLEAMLESSMKQGNPVHVKRL
ncbi:scyllo-inositol 2-dehydrogenase (NADP(+)) IolW-like isoform X1 [Zingiber officinale]|uniref:scyllo-inositol 2-dehydrogenase (NADP(+)) IolW-like isoform X1 n=1 Tax=Zingiber officinale TaxID=94328 RepID=UPI001C4D1163|nr:scyllo-inositol 2-dehydrogenase (NADP(+)) IolW-like isoform X1 [Zingiber officinale]